MPVLNQLVTMVAKWIILHKISIYCGFPHISLCIQRDSQSGVFFDMGSSLKYIFMQISLSHPQVQIIYQEW